MPSKHGSGRIDGCSFPRKSRPTPEAREARQPTSTSLSKPPRSRPSEATKNDFEARRDLLGGPLASVRIRAVQAAASPSCLTRLIQRDTRLAVGHRCSDLHGSHAGRARSHSGPAFRGIGRSEQEERGSLSSSDNPRQSEAHSTCRGPGFAGTSRGGSWSESCHGPRRGLSARLRQGYGGQAPTSRS